MLLKRFEAKTLAATLARVRAECGEHALIVETRQTRQGFLVVAARPELAPARRRGGEQVLLPSKWTRGFQPLAEKATDFGLSATVLSAVENALLGTRVDLSQPGDPALPALASRILAALIRVEPRVEAPDGFRAFALVGPTGVGKTTTLAKLAARASQRGERAAIVTLDVYRMAAVEQLRSFAELLGLPFAVAPSPTELRRALADHAGCDRILIDTTGRSPRCRDGIPLLESTLRAAGVDTVLCLAAGTRARDSQAVLDAYAPLGIDAVCLTKWDETLAPGETVATLVAAGLPMSHLCVGQEVPADILPADARQIAEAAFDVEPAEVIA